MEERDVCLEFTVDWSSHVFSAHNWSPILLHLIDHISCSVVVVIQVESNDVALTYLGIN